MATDSGRKTKAARQQRGDGRKGNHRAARALIELRDYYLNTFGAESSRAVRGVIKQIEQLIAAGYTLEDLWRAVKACETSDERIPEARIRVRDFFTDETVTKWISVADRSCSKPQRPRAALTVVRQRSKLSVERSSILDRGLA